MNIKEAAMALDGSQYCEEGAKTPGLFKTMKENGLVAVFGRSDDLVEFEGAIVDEAGAYDGRMIYLNTKGIIEEPDCDCIYAEEWYNSAKQKAEFVVYAEWCPKDDPETSWRMSLTQGQDTEQFVIYDDDEIYCRGIVFSIRDI